MREFGGRSVIARAGGTGLAVILATCLAACDIASSGLFDTGDPHQVNSVKIDVPAATLVVGDSMTASLVPLYKGNPKMIESSGLWTSSNTGLATVKTAPLIGISATGYSGYATIRATGVGTVIITVGYEGYQASAQITVTSPP